MSDNPDFRDPPLVSDEFSAKLRVVNKRVAEDLRSYAPNEIPPRETVTSIREHFREFWRSLDSGER